MYAVVVSYEVDAIDRIFIVMEYVKRDLNQLMAQMDDGKFTNNHVIALAYNLLCGINLMHQANIFHRDLKPAKILVTDKCTVKICDFGLARSIKGKKQRPMSPHVGSKFYSAPEVICD